MTIVVTGGGSGGHITPLLAVAAELKRLEPGVRIIYIGQRGDSFSAVAAESESIDESYNIAAGKFRRYHGEGFKQIFDIKTGLKNLRDGWRVLAGIWQSYWLLGRIKPDAVFIKGGFVGVPVGLAAAVRRVPYITHDSDATAGLANKIIARWAALRAVALAKENYDYPPAKTVQVGVPVQNSYSPVSPDAQAGFRRKIGLSEYKKIVLVTGGGLGATRINQAVARILPALLRQFPELAVVHLAGRVNEHELGELYKKELSKAEQGRVVLKGYARDLYNYSGAADVIVTRAGATTLAEFAAQAKACILVPNPRLSGGHQLKNADYLAHHRAGRVLTEQDIAEGDTLTGAIGDLLSHPEKRRALSRNLGNLAAADAAERLAMLLLDKAKQN